LLPRAAVLWRRERPVVTGSFAAPGVTLRRPQLVQEAHQVHREVAVR
jgi:hypothetical protein